MNRNALALCLLIASFTLAIVSALGSTSCGRTQDIHDSGPARDNPCVSCHRSAYVATTKPKHEGLFPETCNECHSTKAWVPAKIDFHDAPAFREKPCIGCHKDKYDATTKPKHSPVYPEDCRDCHSTKAWAPLFRNVHDSETAKVTTCASCHIDNYKQAQNPPHDGIFPTQCAGCHGTASWRPAINVSHDWFPLRNRHATLTCTQCHKNGFARGANKPDCVFCHQKDFDAAPANVHVGADTKCTRCHSDAGWKPFFHGWPLTGRHTTTPCAGCHTGAPPVYVGTPKDCVGCHLSDYDASPYPGHSGFSKVCTDCHTTAAWKPAQGGAHPEAKFPITSGAHSEKITCTQCHDPALGQPQGGQNTDCVGCHLGKHTRTSMDAKHAGVRNYPVGPAPPNFCLACHPNGKD